MIKEDAKKSQDIEAFINESDLDESAQSQRPHNFLNALIFPANLTGLGHVGIYTNWEV